MPSAAEILAVDGREVRLTSPDKVYVEALGLTKRDVMDYFLAVGPGILRALGGRPTTMERFPDGVGGESFYVKHLPKHAPEWVGRATVTFPSGRMAVQACPRDLATICWMVNLGSLRFHPWPVRGVAPDRVDQLRLDLDPQPGTGFGEAVRAALALRPLLVELGLSPFVKTSGGRGVHVFCPVEPTDFIDARHAAIAIGRELARRLPELVTVNWWKEERGERIFVDFNQMARDRVMTSAYSVRPSPEARVSAPLGWDELPDADPAAHTVVSMPTRFATVGDPWAAMDAVAPASLAPALAWYARDAEAGEGELPYPPEYPKMAGEPRRVQPSRARRDP